VDRRPESRAALVYRVARARPRAPVRATAARRRDGGDGGSTFGIGPALKIPSISSSTGIGARRRRSCG